MRQARLLAGCLWLASLSAAGGAVLAQPADSAPVVTLTTATLQKGAGPPEPITLPHRWGSDSTAPTTRAVYRLTFDAAATTPQAVFVTGTTLPFVARLNGQAVHSTLLDGPRLTRLRTWRAQPSFHLPPELVRPGPNTLALEVEVPADGWAVLGAVQLGPIAAIEAIAMRNWIVHVGAPLVIGAMLIIVGLAALGLVRSRQDRELFLLFSAGSLLWGVQTFLNQAPEPLLPSPHHEILVMALYAWFPSLVSVFFMRFAYRRVPAYEAAAAIVAVGAAPVMYLGVQFDFARQASIGLRASVLVLISVALVAVLRYAVRTRRAEGAMLLAIGALCVASAIRDFFLSLVRVEVQPVYLTTYTGVLLILFAGWMLLDRYRRSAASYERLARELDERVQQVSGELRHRLEEVQVAREQAEQASRAKSRFFAAASHDLRQPLHSLGLFAAALEPHVHGAEGRQLVRHVGAAIDALKQLFEELLDLSRLDAGHVRVATADVALQELFDRLAVEFHAEAVSRELRLRFAPTRLAAHTDAALLHRVLANLVANALRYTHTGGVLVGARRRGARVWVEVYDTGIGIAAGEVGHIFDELYQVDNPGRDRRQGLGLGLAIVRRITQQLQHPVSVRSVPGRGSCFRVELPLARGAAPAPPASEPLAAVPLPLRRVLVVDDDDIVRTGTGALLRRWGLQAQLVGSLEEAQREIDAGFRPEAALVDLRLGGRHDGLDVVRLLRARLGVPLPALIISGDTGATEAQRVRAAGLTLLSKPVGAAQLRSALVACVTTRATA